MWTEIRSWLIPWYNKYAVLTLSGTVGVGAYEWICWSKLSASDWGTWLGAIGTIATLVGTINLALTETRRRERADLILARLHAASMSLRLIHVRSAIVAMRDRLEGAHEWATPRIFSDCLAILNKIKIWSIEDLVPLVPLPSDTAIKLAKVKDQLDSLRTVFENEIANTPTQTDSARKSIAKVFSEDLLETHRYVSDAISVCTKAGALLAQTDRENSTQA